EQDNLYRSLGLGRTAGRSEIASAYRRMARLYHVDRHPEADREHAARRWAEISGAHEVLNDPRRRFLYD
ncbi:DnaJ domain-containing protein, partial [Pavlovales sp. CCMP2436]